MARAQTEFHCSLDDAHHDAGETEKTRVRVAVDRHDLSLELDIEGTGVKTMEPGFGGCVYLEKYNGVLRLLVWSDINQEDPTHVISLEGAREKNRKDDESAAGQDGAQ